MKAIKIPIRNLAIPGFSINPILHILLCAAVMMSLPLRLSAEINPDTVQVHWLGDHAPLLEQGVSWGVPWTSGIVSKDQAFVLTAADGKTMPLQTWPLAYWPDGTVKWLGCATVAGPMNKGPMKLSPGRSKAVSGAIRISETGEGIEVNTGALICRIPDRGGNLIARRCKLR